MSSHTDTDFYTSDSQSEDGTRFDILLVANNSDKKKEQLGAQLKSDFTVQAGGIGGEEQARHVLDKDISQDGLTVQCDIDQVIHGTMVEGGMPATLIVFQFAFVPRGKHRRFKRAEITITFSDGDIYRITPNGKYATFKSQKRQELSHSISPELEASLGPVSAKAGYTWELKESQEIKGHATICGLTLSRRQGGSPNQRKNQAVWVLSENEQTDSGIPSFVQTAVILERNKIPANPQGQRFSAEIEISGTVDNQEWLKDRLQKMSGKSKKGEGVIFNPEKIRGTVKDPNNLKNVNLDLYKQLVTIREWVDGGETLPQQDLVIANEITGGDLTSLSPVRQDSDPAATLLTSDGTAIDPFALEGREETPIHIPAILDSGEGQLPVGTTGFIAQGDKDGTTPLDNEEKQRKLNNLEERLSLVRKEAKLVAQLVLLVREEKEIVQEIQNLQGGDRISTE